MSEQFVAARRTCVPGAARSFQAGGGVANLALVGGESWFLRRVAQGVEHEPQSVGLAPLREKGESKEDGELRVVGKLAGARAQHLGRTLELAERAQRGAEADQRPGKFIRRQ